MDTFLMLHNGSLNIALSMLSDDATLALGADAFDASTGSTRTRLEAALQAMVAQCKHPVDVIEFDCDLDACTVIQLRALADRHGVYLSSDTRRKADIISALRAAQSARHRYS